MTCNELSTVLADLDKGKHTPMDTQKPNSSTSSCNPPTSSCQREQKLEKIRQHIAKLKMFIPESNRDLQNDKVANIMKTLPLTAPPQVFFKENDGRGLIAGNSDFEAGLDADDAQQDWYYITISLREGMIVQASPELVELLGYPESLWYRKDMCDIIYKKDFVTVFGHLNNRKYASSSDEESSRKKPKSFFYFRLKKYKNLKQGFRLGHLDRLVVFKGLIKEYQPAPGLFYLRTSPKRTLKYTILMSKIVTSAYTGLTEGKSLAVNSFEMQHNLSCEYTLMDANATPLVGYLPQDITSMSIFDTIHTENWSDLYDIYTKVKQNPGKRLRGAPMRFKVRSGEYIECETDWSSYVNPFTQRIDFISCQHTIIRYPENLDVFSNPPTTYQDNKFARLPASSKSQEHVDKSVIAQQKLQWKIRVLLTSFNADKTTKSTNTGSRTELSESEVMQSTPSEKEEVRNPTTAGIVFSREEKMYPLVVAKVPYPSEEPCFQDETEGFGRGLYLHSGQEVDINLVYDGLIYDYKIKTFLLQLSAWRSKTEADDAENDEQLPITKDPDQENRNEETPKPVESTPVSDTSVQNANCTTAMQLGETASVANSKVELPGEPDTTFTLLTEDVLKMHNQQEVERFVHAHRHPKTPKLEKHKHSTLSRSFPVIPMDAAQLVVPSSRNVLQHGNEGDNLNVGVKFIPRPPSFASSTKALVSEVEKFEEAVHEELEYIVEPNKEIQEDTKLSSATTTDEDHPASMHTAEELSKLPKGAQLLMNEGKHKMLYTELYDGSQNKKFKGDTWTMPLAELSSTLAPGCLQPGRVSFDSSSTSQTPLVRPHQQEGRHSCNGATVWCTGPNDPRPPRPHHQFFPKPGFHSGSKPWVNKLKQRQLRMPEGYCSDTSIEETSSSFSDFLVLRNDRRLRFEDRKLPVNETTVTNCSQLPFWLSNVNWTPFVVYKYAVENVRKHVRRIPMLRLSYETEGIVTQLKEIIQVTEEEEPQKKAATGDYDFPYMDEYFLNSANKDVPMAEVSEESNSADTPCNQSEGNSIEQELSCDLSRENMPTQQKAGQEERRTPRPQSDKMSNSSDNTRCSIGKASSDLTSSELRSNEEAGSSLKESYCTSGSNVSVSHTSTKSNQEFGGAYSNLFVPIRMKCESKPSSFATWVVNSNFGNHVRLKYQRSSTNRKEVLQQTRDTMHNIPQPSGLHLQLRELFKVAGSPEMLLTSEEDATFPQPAPQICELNGGTKQAQIDDDNINKSESLENNENSDEGIDNGGSGSSGQDTRSPEEGTGSSGGNTGSGDRQSSQYAESGFSSMKTAKQSPSSGASDTPPKKIGNSLTGEWKDMPDLANCGRTYPDKGLYHFPEFNLHIVREGATIMNALFAESGTDVLELEGQFAVDW